MKEQQTAIYLRCTKNKSFQKKHIDVCRKCSSNHGCREFQEYKQPEPVAPGSDRFTPKPTEIPLAYIIEQLIEIRKLVGRGQPRPLLNGPDDTFSFTKASLQQYLKAELERIKSLCLTAHSSRC